MSRVSPGPASAAPDDGAAAPARARGSRLLVLGIAVGALAVVAAIVARQHDGPESVPEQVTAAYIEAWNHRDARAVSDLTCLWPPAFTPANVVEEQFSADPAGVPHVSEYSVIETQPDRLSGRDVVAVRLRYVRDGEGRTRAATVYVRLDDTQDPCLASLTTW